jgi:phage terminase small subunit
MSEETKPKPLTRKQRVFVAEYLKVWNASEAARRAGYSEKTAYSIGWENLRKPEIQAEIDRRLEDIHMGANEALAILAEQARGDIGEFFDISSVGFSLDLKEAQEKGITRLIKEIEQKVITINGKQEDKEIITTKVKLHDPQAAIEKILRVQGKFKDVGTPENPAKVIFEIIRKDLPNPTPNPPPAAGGVPVEPGEAQGDRGGQAGRENDGS